MSFEIFVQCFDRGKPAGIPQSVIRPLFPVVEAESEPNDWLVRYDDYDWCRISLGPLAQDSSLVESLAAYRPCGDPRFWDAMLAVLRLGPAVLYFPGSAPPLIATREAGEQLPADMVEAMGQPRLVHSGQEIVEIIRYA